MKFMNTHLPTLVPAVTWVFAKVVKPDWNERHYLTEAGHDYDRQMVLPINEHIDNCSDDPLVVAPPNNWQAGDPVTPQTDRDYLDIDDSVFHYFLTSDTPIGKGYEDCEADRPTNDFWRATYMNDFNHWNSVGTGINPADNTPDKAGLPHGNAGA